MAVRKVRHGSNFLLTAIALFVILAVINLFSYRHFTRWDLTENKEYTVSQATRELTGGLQNLINIKVYLSKNLPAEILMFERQLRDLLTEYESYGKGKLRIEYEYPGDSREEIQELMFEGIRPQPVAVFKRDTATQAQIYNSVVVQFENRKEVITSLLEESGRGRVGLRSDFEYLLTSKIFQCQRATNPVIGWLTGAPNLDLNKEYRTLREIVRREWDARDVRFETATQIAADIAVLVLIGPRTFTEQQLFELDQYVMRGGRILALVETYERESRGGGLEGLAAKPTNFARLLETYGLKVNQDIVADPAYPARAVQQGRFIAPYAFWVNILPKGLNRQNPAVARLGKLTLPWTHSLEKSSSAPATAEFVSLAHTSERSIVRWGQRVIPDLRMPTEEQSKAPKSRTVIAALSGTFPSAFPQGTPYPADPATTGPRFGRTPENERKYGSVDTRLVVVGGTLFVQDDFLQISRFTFEGNENLPFFMNALDWLAVGKGLAEIRSRQWASRPIKSQIPDWRRTAHKVAGTFVMPIVVIAGGIAYNVIRRRRRRAIADYILSRHNK